MRAFGNFKDVIEWTSEKMYDSCYEVHTEKWQGKDIKQDDRFAMIEILNHSFTCQVSPDLDVLREQIRPNVAWADEHFQERVGGIPLNPPPSIKGGLMHKRIMLNLVGSQNFLILIPKESGQNMVSLIRKHGTIKQS